MRSPYRENSVASSGVLPMDAASDSGTRAPPKGTALKVGKTTIFSQGNTGNTMGFRGKKIGKKKSIPKMFGGLKIRISGRESVFQVES